MYELITRDGLAKRADFDTPHGTFHTPMFMNVATAAAIKGALSAADLEQIKTDTQAQNTLKRLKSLDQQGKNILLVCFCTDKNLCHRSLIAKILKDMGCNVTVN